MAITRGCYAASFTGAISCQPSFFQTVHEKSVVGGVLSRISDHRVGAIRRYPLLDALIQLSEGKSLPPGADEMLIARAPEFLARANIGYVVIDHTRASPALVNFAERTLHLEALASDGPFILYRPVSLPLSR